ncbi:MAG: ORF6N domain-containing protein [Candidatus Omnitrophota bacterium]
MNIEEMVKQKIYLIRGQKVMLDRDLAELYGVSTKVLNQAVKRNTGRFPADFMFRLTNKEKDKLVTNCDRFKTLKHSTVTPSVFTEHGILMLSSVLNSEHAIQINIAIVRIFIKLREIFFNHKKLAIKLNELERKVEDHDKEIEAIFDVIRELMEPVPQKPKGKIGFCND